jgi:hypothetical protein
VRNAAGAFSLYSPHLDLNYGVGTDGTFALQSTFNVNGAPAGNVNPGWLAIQEAGDFNGDGRADILLRNSVNGLMVAYESTTASADAAFTGVVVGTASSDSTVVGVGDFNGDGLADILWRRTSGDTYVWASGHGQLSAGAQDIAQVNPGWILAGIGDFNADGRADILWRNSVTPTILAIYDSVVGSTVSFTGVSATGLDASWSIVAIGDYNGDGRSDILWRNAATGIVTSWESTGHGFTQNVIDTTTIPAGWSDISPHHILG